LKEAVGFKKIPGLNVDLLLGPHRLGETKNHAYDHVGQPHISYGCCAGKLATDDPVKNDFEQVAGTKLSWLLQQGI
jgi:hypothetical protein